MRLALRNFIFLLPLSIQAVFSRKTLIFKIHSTKTNKAFYPRKNLTIQNDFYRAIEDKNYNFIKNISMFNFDFSDYIHKGQTALHMAVKNNDIELMKLIISLGGNENTKNIHGKTPLQLATLHENYDAIITLLENNALANETNLNQATALHLACALENSNTKLSIIVALIKHGANIEARNNLFQTPLHLLCGYKHDIDAMKILMRLGANPMNTDYTGRNCLEIASHYGNNECLEILKNHLIKDNEVNDISKHILF